MNKSVGIFTLDLKMKPKFILLVFLTVHVQLSIQDCTEPPSMEYALMAYDNVTDGSVTSYVCEEGAHMLNCDSGTTIQCNGSDWSANTTYCALEDCGNPPVVNLILPIQDFSTTNGSVVEYHCEEGYEPENDTVSNSVWCQTNGNWSELQLECVNKDCGLPENDTHAVAIYSSGTVYESSVIYICEIGYHLAENHSCDYSIECNSTGLWEYHPDGCEKRDCGIPPTEPHSLALYDNTTFESNVTYICEQGYDMEGGDTFMCNSSGLWETPTFTCQRVNCSDPPLLSHAHMILPETTTLLCNNAEYTCDVGYNFQNDRNITNIQCIWTGNWSVITDFCEAVDCGRPESRPNSRSEFGNTTFMSVANFTCNTGYVFGDGVSNVTYTTCLANASWSQLDSYCTRLNCSSPPVINGLNLSYSTTLYEDITTYTCFEGFELPNNMGYSQNSTCRDDFNWSPVNSTCQVVDCGPPEIRPNSRSEFGNTTFMSFANFTCITGYVFVDGVSNVTDTTCLANASWSQLDFDCTRISCGLLPVFVNMTLDSDNGTVFESVAYYDCDENHYFPDNPDSRPSRCLANGTWSEVNNTCTEAVHDCGQAPNLVNGRYSLSTVNRRQVATYTCDNDFWMSDGVSSSILTCSRNGNWPNLTISCIQLGALNCPAIGAMSHTRVTTVSRVIGGIVTYTCDEGYKFPDQSFTRSTICLPTGEWYDTIGPCQRIQCPTELTLPNARCSVPRSNFVNARARCTCDPGYYFENGMDVDYAYCSRDREWQIDSTGCQIRCGVLPLVANARVVGMANHSYGASVQFACFRGNKFTNGIRQNTVTCENGRWANIDKCYIEVCDALPASNYTSHSTEISVYGTEVVSTCQPGYNFRPGITSVAFICEQNSTWNATLEPCVEIVCNEPPVVTNANRTGDSSVYLFNDEVVYTCHEGFGPAIPGSSYENVRRHADGTVSKSIRCMDTDTWSESEITCEFGRCAPARNITYATKSGSGAEQDSVVTYTCDEGYRFANTSARTLTIMCGDQLSWNDTMDVCQRLVCPSEQIIPHGVLNVLDTVYGSIAELECDYGYEIANETSMFLTCADDRIWQNQTVLDLGCEAVDCGSPPTGSYMPRPDYTTTTLGSQASYRCASGHWFSENVYDETSECQGDGRWSFQNPACSEIACEPITVNDGISGNTTSNVAGTIVSYFCDRDAIGNTYAFPDESTEHRVSTCLDNGIWSPAIVQCVKTSDPYSPPATESESAPYIGAVGIALISLEFTFMVVIDFPSLVQAFHQLVNTLKGR